MVAASILTFLVAAVFYYAFFSGRSATEPVGVNPPVTREPAFRHPLTGEGVATATPFFVAHVMYDNLLEVKMRPGLEGASIIYEALTEGGITRLMALFDSTRIVEKVGPIRSVRPYFIDWASEYGGILMHVGGSPEALKQILRSSDIVSVNQIGAHESLFVRDESKSQPHNVFSSSSSWLKAAERFDVPFASFQPWKFHEDGEKPTTTVRELDITFSPGLEVTWVYTAERDRYVRFTNDERELFSSGEEVQVRNVLVLVVPTKTIDAIGRQRMETLGTGSAVLYSRGGVVTGTWEKETRASRMRLVKEDGSEFVFAPGVTWVEIVPDLGAVSNQE